MTTIRQATKEAEKYLENSCGIGWQQDIPYLDDAQIITEYRSVIALHKHLDLSLQPVQKKEEKITKTAALFQQHLDMLPSQMYHVSLSSINIKKLHTIAKELKKIRGLYTYHYNQLEYYVGTSIYNILLLSQILTILQADTCLIEVPKIKTSIMLIQAANGYALLAPLNLDITEQPNLEKALEVK
ncbi:MAG: hypothetical protein Q4F74_02410 [Synergistaceae bacterium]|nr:hypothetical protein [Synergistaceae bacterium]